MCNCGKSSSGRSIRQAHAQRQGKLPVGVTRDAAKQIGEADGVIRRVRVARAVEGMRPNASVWVTGDGVDALLEAGAVVDITNTQQKARQYKVGPFTYSDKATANRVAAARGTIPIEVA